MESVAEATSQEQSQQNLHLGQIMMSVDNLFQRCKEGVSVLGQIMMSVDNLFQRCKEGVSVLGQIMMSVDNLFQRCKGGRLVSTWSISPGVRN
jgi:hypothetical protein